MAVTMSGEAASSGWVAAELIAYEAKDCEANDAPYKLPRCCRLERPSDGGACPPEAKDFSPVRRNLIYLYGQTRKTG